MTIEYPMTGPASSFAVNDVILGDPLTEGGSGLLLVCAQTDTNRIYINLDTAQQKDPSGAEVFTLKSGAKVVGL